MKKKLKNIIGNIVKGNNDKPVDMLLEMAKNQGYVKLNCKLPGQLVMALVSSEGSACKGCNHTGCE